MQTPAKKIFRLYALNSLKKSLIIPAFLKTGAAADFKYFAFRLKRVKRNFVSRFKPRNRLGACFSPHFISAKASRRLQIFYCDRTEYPDAAVRIYFIL